MGFFTGGSSSQSSSSTTNTTTEVNSRNRSLASSVNNNNSGNLAIGFGTEGDPFSGPGDNVKITALLVVGAVAGVALLIFLWRKT